MKRMLINATQMEEVRVALVDGQKLYDLDIESPQHANKKSNIYKGVITRVEPSLEAAFVDYGVERHGFLPLKEISREYYPEGTNFSDHAAMRTAIREGQEIIVQIEKEERGLKGAALTSFVSLAGSYLVLMPNNPRAGGISRRIEGDDRTELKAALKGLEIPEGMGVIVRTAGVGKSGEELEWDLSILIKLWDMIKKAASSRKAPFLIYQESSIALRAIRDYLRPDIGEILVDDKKAYEQVLHYVQLVRPEFIQKIHLYSSENIPLFSKFQIESQIDSAYKREVRLPSGGAIVIDPTEALTSIDVNSAKATKGGDIEETALQTNIEAAEEIARQLRLRDVGGLVVIDFIDMTPLKNQREIENRMREAVRQDRARIQFSRISRFGLLEMSRQRLRPSLEESSSHVCPMCSGQGTVRDTSSLALSILRLIEEEAHKGNHEDVYAVAPVEVATFILNEKRKRLAEIEKNNGIRVTIIPDKHYMPQEYLVQRVSSGGRDQTISTLEILAERDAEARRSDQEKMAGLRDGMNVAAQPHDIPAVSAEEITSDIKSPIPESASQHKSRTRAAKPQEERHPSFVSGIRSFFDSLLGIVTQQNDESGRGVAKSGEAEAAAPGATTAVKSEDTAKKRSQDSRHAVSGAARRSGERTEHQERAERSERSGRSERAGRGDRDEMRSGRSERDERSERSGRAERGEHVEREERQGSEERQNRRSARSGTSRRKGNEAAESGEKSSRSQRSSHRGSRGEREEGGSRRALRHRPGSSEGIQLKPEQLMTEPEAFKPYEVRERVYSSEEAGAPENVPEPEFAELPSQVPESAGAEYEYSARAGGLKDVHPEGIEGISVPEAREVDYSYVPEERPESQAAPYEHAGRAGGLGAALKVASVRATASGARRGAGNASGSTASAAAASVAAAASAAEVTPVQPASAQTSAAATKAGTSESPAVAEAVTAAFAAAPDAAAVPETVQAELEAQHAVSKETAAAAADWAGRRIAADPEVQHAVSKETAAAAADWAGRRIAADPQVQHAVSKKTAAVAADWAGQRIAAAPELQNTVDGGASAQIKIVQAEVAAEAEELRGSRDGNEEAVPQTAPLTAEDEVQTTAGAASAGPAAEPAAEQSDAQAESVAEDAVPAEEPDSLMEAGDSEPEPEDDSAAHSSRGGSSRSRGSAPGRRGDRPGRRRSGISSRNGGRSRTGSAKARSSSSGRSRKAAAAPEKLSGEDNPPSEE